MGGSKSVEFELNVLTLNCWCIPHISKDIDQRVNAISAQLADSNYDIVCLQEVWSEEIYNKIKGHVSSALPYSHFFYSGVVGSGTCVLSKLPLESAIYQEWPVNGFAHKINHGDWFGGKGVGLCVLRRGDARIQLCTTHLIAEYSDRDEYACHRAVQGFHLARWVALTAPGAELVLVVGDLNAECRDLPCRLVRRVGRLHDTGAGDVRATNECPANSYFRGKTSDSKRIDYILYRCGPNTSASVASYHLPFPSRIPGGAISFSDHEAVLATLLVSTRSAQAGLRRTEVRLKRDEGKEFQLLWSGQDWEVFVLGEGDRGTVLGQGGKRDFHLIGKGGDWRLTYKGQNEVSDEVDGDNEDTKLIGREEKKASSREVKRTWMVSLRAGANGDEMVLSFDESSSYCHRDSVKEWELLLLAGDELSLKEMPETEMEVLKEAVLVCEDGLRKVAAAKRRYVIFSCLCLLGLVVSHAVSEVFGVRWMGVIHMLVTLLFGYFVTMATLGCRTERNGILGAKNSMELALNRGKPSSWG